MERDVIAGVTKPELASQGASTDDLDGYLLSRRLVPLLRPVEPSKSKPSVAPGCMYGIHGTLSVQALAGSETTTSFRQPIKYTSGDQETAGRDSCLNCSLVAEAGCHSARETLAAVFAQHPNPMKHGLKSISIENLIPVESSPKKSDSQPRLSMACRPFPK